MASTVQKLTKKQARQLHREACKEIACQRAADGNPLCPFCPWEGKTPAKEIK